MSKIEKRIKALEKEISELKSQLIGLSLRGNSPFIPIRPIPLPCPYEPNTVPYPVSPWTITCS